MTTTTVPTYRSYRSLELLYRNGDDVQLIMLVNLETMERFKNKEISLPGMKIMSEVLGSAGMHENLYESLTKGYYEAGDQGEDCPRRTQTGRCDERFRKGPRTGPYYDERGRGTQQQENTSAGEIPLDRTLLSNVLTR
ncbi:hypothetical protein [Alphaentomopoxvirus acuprea]|uniref:Uncharacterized protein n=1 Tax=Alphaentomopoxvirus acuprea TaxID=62099 RepID=W6JLJ4_9POXV|nr:hypothetical protein BA82_gp136 [Anomala cuprea entomopoxvirus]BAO49496.1 hypothetical protein [Anomala cuprea entomopoxvirus]